jgi:hypothetical protein
MSKLTVVYLKDTGHVLAALTRADPPAAAEAVRALTGAGLPIGPIDGASAAITIPAAMLHAVTVDDQPGATLDPLGFQVVEDPQRLKPPMVTGAGVQGSTVTLTIRQSNGATVTVTNVPSAAPLTAVVALQKAASPTPAAIIVVTTVTVGSPGVVVLPPGGFVTSDNPGGLVPNDNWNMYAFVQSLRPAAALVQVAP